MKKVDRQFPGLQTRFHARGLRALAVVSLLPAWGMMTAGCRRSTAPAAETASADPPSFAAVFQNHCAGCHGNDGQFGPAPPLNDALLLAWMPEKEFRQTVREGREGTLMPAFVQDRGGRLTDQEIDALVREIYKHWGDPSLTPQHLPAFQPPPTTQPHDVRVANGRKLFGLICARCHGTEGRGKDAGPLHDTAFLALISDQALRRIVVTGRPDLGMPDYQQLGKKGGLGHPLTSSEIEDIVTYVTTWRSPPLETQPSKPRSP